MRNRPVATARKEARRRAYLLTRKSIVSVAALAGLASLTLLDAVLPAAAKPMTRCQVKHSFCVDRCIMKPGAEDSISRSNSCVSRTCDHQFRACARDSGESSDPHHDREGMTPPKRRGGTSRRVASPEPQDGVRVPLGRGILDQGGGFSSQGPAAAGAPLAPRAPAAPPVIIR